MDRDSNQMEQHPVQCRNGCGFYGNAGTDGLCSLCYKETVKKKQMAPTGMPASLTSQPSLSSEKSSSCASVDTATPTIVIPSAEKKSQESETSGSQLATASAATDQKPETPKSESPKAEKKKKNRCLTCKKKVGLTGFSCRCGGLFCSLHRYSDKHDCSFDYREMGAEEIRKSNPLVVASKIQKI